MASRAPASRTTQIVLAIASILAALLLIGVSVPPYQPAPTTNHIIVAVLGVAILALSIVRLVRAIRRSATAPAEDDGDDWNMSK